MTQAAPTAQRTKASLILEAIQNNPGRTARQIDEILGFKHMAHKQLSRLRKKNLVYSTKEGTTLRWWTA